MKFSKFFQNTILITFCCTFLQTMHTVTDAIITNTSTPTTTSTVLTTTPVVSTSSTSTTSTISSTPSTTSSSLTAGIISNTPTTSSISTTSTPSTTISTPLTTSSSSTVSSTALTIQEEKKNVLEADLSSKEINKNAPVISIKVAEDYTFNGPDGSEIFPDQEMLDKKKSVEKLDSTVMSAISSNNKQKLVITGVRESRPDEEPYPIIVKKNGVYTTIARVRVVQK